jgi:hypothetical protein
MERVSAARASQRNAIDFIVIGAQKSGTTSLRAYLRRHPSVYVPESEDPFFIRSWFSRRSWDRYFQRRFSKVDQAKILGKVTPHYMTDRRVPTRIRKVLPSVRLIALLRNPIDRAFSHYRMAVRRGQDRRTFEEACTQLIEEGHARRARRLNYRPAVEHACYLVWGEYGRILGDFLGSFARHQLRVFFTEDLAARPADVYMDILAFLGLPGHIPENLGQRYQPDIASRSPLPWWVETRTFLANIASGLLRRSACWGMVAGSGPGPPTEHSLRTRSLLADYFRSDVQRLEALLDLRPPWPEFQEEASTGALAETGAIKRSC